MPAFRQSSDPVVYPARRARHGLAAGALAAVLGLAACTPAPAPDSSPASPAPSSTSTSSSTSTVGAGSAADCAALAATVATESPRSGNITPSGDGAPALKRSDGGTSAVADADISRDGASPDASTAPGTKTGSDAAVEVTGGSRLSVQRSTATSTGTGTGGVSSTGTGTLVEAGDTTVNTEGGSATGIAARDGGAVTGTNLTVSTSGENANALAAAGGGQISLNSSTALTTGDLSAAVYSAGDVSVCGLAGTSRSAEAAVVEGANTLTSTRSTLDGGTHGMRFYQAAAGGPAGGSLTVSGGSLAGRTGDAVLIEGVPATVTINDGAALSAGSGRLVNVTGGGSGTVDVTETALSGNLAAEPGSGLDVSLSSNSSVSGTLTNVGLTLDTTSRITLQSDSTAASVAGAEVSGNNVLNITGNGHSLTYDPSAAGNSYLAGGTYNLAQGGSLSPGDVAP